MNKLGKLKNYFYICMKCQSKYRIEGLSDCLYCECGGLLIPINKKAQKYLFGKTIYGREVMKR